MTSEELPRGLPEAPQASKRPQRLSRGCPWVSLGVLGGVLGRPWGSLGTAGLSNDWKNNTNFWLFNGFQSCQGCLHMPTELLQGQPSDLLVTRLLQDPLASCDPPLRTSKGSPRTTGPPKPHHAPGAASGLSRGPLRAPILVLAGANPTPCQNIL